MKYFEKLNHENVVVSFECSVYEATMLLRN